MAGASAERKRRLLGLALTMATSPVELRRTSCRWRRWRHRPRSSRRRARSPSTWEALLLERGLDRPRRTGFGRQRSRRQIGRRWILQAQAVSGASPPSLTGSAAPAGPAPDPRVFAPNRGARILADGHPRRHRGLRGHRGAGGRRPGPDHPGLGGVHGGRPARQGGGRVPRAGARRPDRLGARAAGQAHHRQPGARRPAEGGLALRSADRARRHGGDRRDPGRRARPATACWANSPSTAASRGSTACCRPPSRRRPGTRADMPGLHGSGGGLGRRRPRRAGARAR